MMNSLFLLYTGPLSIVICILLLRHCSGKGLHLAMTGEPLGFSSCGRILELRRGIQDASCVGPGKSNLPLELRRKAGDCSRVTAGPIDLI